MKLIKKMIHLFNVASIWTRLTIHNTWGVINVFNIVWVNPMKGGLLDENHHKGIPKNELSKFQEFLIKMKNKRTPSCHAGLVQVLNMGLS